MNFIAIIRRSEPRNTPHPTPLEERNNDDVGKDEFGTVGGIRRCVVNKDGHSNESEDK